MAHPFSSCGSGARRAGGRGPRALPHPAVEIDESHLLDHHKLDVIRMLTNWGIGPGLVRKGADLGDRGPAPGAVCLGHDVEKCW
ncbi:hypothetical protein CP975_34375 [Streptomyces alboniger]|uniref:Uncharacterized protein n=1 Tax=Streptomyces alboniger TaxID=132473 RepID=A0A5J6HU02_STRAD|nr:hypothetical protein CP975_34375 [Streptomyces alboniger]